MAMAQVVRKSIHANFRPSFDIQYYLTSILAQVAMVAAARMTTRLTVMLALLTPVYRSGTLQSEYQSHYRPTSPLSITASTVSE